MKSLAALAAIWIAIAVAWWFTTGAELARAATPSKQVKWEDIASFYSGGNMKTPIEYTWTNSNGTTGLHESGNINLNPALQKHRDMFLDQWFGKKKDFATRRGAVINGMPFLTTLIHEALHNRANSKDLDFGAEVAPTDLGVRLIPDLMQRFFGVKMDSKLGKEITDITLRSLRRP